MRLNIFLLTFLLSLCAISSRAQLYTFKNFNHRDGLNMAAISSIAQTDDGYLWIGTDGGPLIKFDGYNFEEIEVPKQDNNHHVENLNVHNDSIYFASKFKGFFAYSIKHNSYKHFKYKDRPFGEYIAITKSEKQHLLIGTRGIFADLNGKLKALYKIKDSSPSFELYHFINYQSGVLVFTNYGSFQIEKGKIKPFYELLNMSKSRASDFRFGSYHNNKLTLFNAKADRSLEIILNKDGSLGSIIESDREFIFSENEYITSFYSQNNPRNSIALTNKGSLYKIRGLELDKIAHNLNSSLESPYKVISDLNGDFWVCSLTKGLYKISLEPFTKIQINPVFEAEDIMLPYRTVYNDIFISLFSGKSYVGRIEGDRFTEFPFSIKAVTQIDGEYYVATNLGIKKFNSGDSPKFEDLFFKNENITFLMSNQGKLWAGVAGKGIVKIDINTGHKTFYKKKSPNLPHYFYTGQVGLKGNSLVFGTNAGIYQYTSSKDSFEKIKLPNNLGSYSGCSAKDIYGTMWFTLEKGIVGIQSNSDIKILHGKDHFKTNLYYTLNCDLLGNLIVGTNKGVTVLKLNQKGELSNKSHYDANTGFGGYETHMRSQFQSDNNIYVGTVEGLYLINTDILDQLKTPLPPVITDLTHYDVNGSDKINSFHYKFHVNNPKIGAISYKYRLVGQNDNWTTLIDNNTVNLYNLDNGKYILEVKATYDSENFSKISQHVITVNLPIWKTTWFIIAIMISIVGVNLFLVNYSRAFGKTQLIKTKDVDVHIRMTPSIILFGLIAVTSAHVLGPLIDANLDLHLGLVLTTGFSLLVLYFLARSVLNTANESFLNKLLLIGVAIVMLHIYLEIYFSNLHPFHFLGIVLTTMVVPYFLNSIKSMVIFTSLILLATMLITISVNSPVFPKTLYVVLTLAHIGVLIFSSYLRSDSLEKLIFISGIINRSSIPALAFDADGKIIYSSENISNYIDSSHEEIVNQNISILNNFVPYEDRFREIDVVKDLKDGEKYLVPMANNQAKVHWVEWEYKDFSSEVKVLLGQDVTEKMVLENTYELLVQNAEDFIYRCDINGNFLFLNETSFEKLGYQKEELINSNSLDIVDPKYLQEVSSYYEEHFAQRKSFSYKEFPIKCKNGDTIWIGQHVTTLYAPGSNTFITGFIALARDITEIRLQQKLIKDQRDDITASINYARRIQFNLLPHERNFATQFKEHFIFYRPKDIVSGDFYWMEKIGKHTILALADCTGHGVPGSFMTLLGINLLNSVVLEGRLTDPGEILNEIDKRLVDVLPKGEGENRLNDGIEMTICVFDDNSNELTFACAGSRFLIYENASFTMLKGDNKHIGDEKIASFVGYNTHYTSFTQDSNLYLFTDGFQDQFGGPNDKKFSFRRILELFESNVDLSLNEQRSIIEGEFNNWIGQGDQTDDVTIVSVKKNII